MPRAILIGCFALSLALVLGATLWPAAGRPPPGATLDFLAKGLHLADAFRNVLLFLPLGATLALLLRAPLVAVAMAAALSISLEVAQFLVPGRYPTLEDLLMNACGALLGAGLALTARFWISPGRRLAGLLQTAATLGVLALLIFTARLFEPWLPTTQYYGGWTVERRHLEHYQGEVRSVSLAGVPIAHGPVPDSAALRRLLRQGAPLEIRATAGAAPEELAPLFTIHDDGQREILLVGVKQEDLVVSRRVRGRAIRFEQPVVHMPGWLAGVEAGADLDLLIQRQDDGYCIRLNERERCGVGPSTGSGWTFVFLPRVVPGALREWMDVAWLVLLTLPIGYWHRRRGFTAICTVAVMVAVFGLPVLTPLVPPGPWEIVAPVLGVALGIGLARRVRPRGDPAAT